MGIYIRSTLSISPQNTFLADSFPAELIRYEGKMNCILPDFKNYFPPMQLRRMNYLIKNGNACAIETMKNAGISSPDAIMLGTGLGCMEDTEKFLNTMLDHNEGILTPTTFIQSIHNTVGGSIALHHQCNGHNLVYAHKTVSFESALLDAVLMLNDNEAKNVLVGGVDEITNENFSHKKIVKVFRDSAVNTDIITNKGVGSIAGEGITFFMLTAEKSDQNIAECKRLDFRYSITDNQVRDGWITSFLEKANVSKNDVDLVFVGMNGNASSDAIYDTFLQNNFPAASHAIYKNMCGEYDTASSFAMWLSAYILKLQQIPSYCLIKDSGKKPSNILIYNQDNFQNHSLILLSKC